MPIYEYRCENCGNEHEVMQKITEKPLTVCRDCGGSLKKMISNTSFVLKGSGWYLTDYGDKNSRNNKKDETADNKGPAGSPAKKETKEEKTETTAGTDTKKQQKPEPNIQQKTGE